MCRSAVRQSYERKEEYRMKTNRLHKIVILVAISILLLCGCGRKIDSVELTNRLSEKEIEDLIAEEIRKETGEKVIVKVESKDELFFIEDGVGGTIDGEQPFAHRYDVPGGYTYHLKILSTDLKYEGNGYYRDGYKKVYKKKSRGTEEVTAEYFYSFNMPTVYRFIRDVEELLDKNYAHFHVAYQNADSKTDFDFFILDPDFADRRDVLTEILKKIDGFAGRYREDSIFINYRVFLTEDETIYKTTDFYASPVPHDRFTEIRPE